MVGDLEKGLVFKSLGCDHLVEEVHHVFSLAGDLHYDHGVVEEVAAVVFDRKSLADFIE